MAPQKRSSPPRSARPAHADGCVRLCAFHATDRDLAALLQSFLLSATAIGERTTIVCSNARSRARIAGALASTGTDLAEHLTVELLRGMAGARLAGRDTSGLDAILQRPGRVIVYQPVPVGLPLAPASPRCSMILWLHDLSASTAAQAADAIEHHSIVMILREGHHSIVGGASARVPSGTDPSFGSASPLQSIDELGARMASIAALYDLHIADPANHNLLQTHIVAVLAQVRDAVVVTDARMRLVAWNEAAVQLFGWTAGEVLGRGIWEVLCTEETARDWVEARRCLADGGTHRGDWLQRRRDGSMLRVEGETITLRDTDGEVMYYVSLHREITSKWLADERLRLMVDALPAMVAITHADGTNWFRNRRWREYTGLDLCNADDATCASVFHPDDIDAFGSAWKKAVTNGETFEREVRVRRHDGVHRLFLGHGLPLRNTNNEIIGWYGTMTDIEDRRQMELALHLEAGRALHLAEMSQRFAAAGPGLPQVLETVVRCAVELIGDSCVVRLLSDDRRTLVPVAIDNRDPARLEQIRTSGLVTEVAADGPLRRPLLQGGSVRIPVMDEDALRMLQSELRGPISPYPVSSLLLVPMRVAGDVIGSFALSRDHPGKPYTEEELALAQDFADRAALSVQNARLFDSVSSHREHLQQMARRQVEMQESESGRLARELHDQLGQSLGGLALRLGAVRDLLFPRQRRAQAVLRDAEAIAGSVLQDVRRIIATLRPPLLDELGLRPALQRIGTELAGDTGAAVELLLDEYTQRLSSEIEIAVYRITQEATNNIRMHSHASHVLIALQVSEVQLQLQVEDDGVGFEYARVKTGGLLWPRSATDSTTGHFGLLGMRERAAGLGGICEIHSSRGNGTRIRVLIPVETSA